MKCIAILLVFAGCIDAAKSNPSVTACGSPPNMPATAWTVQSGVESMSAEDFAGMQAWQSAQLEWDDCIVNQETP